MRILEKYPKNVNNKLFESWQTCYRFGDAKEIASKFKNAKYTTIHRALKYGHCVSVELQTFISSYFRKRIQEEKQLAMKHINNLKN